MNIAQLMSGAKVNCIQVNVLKRINSTQIIVADNTGLAIMNLTSDEKQIEIGKGLKIAKPSVQGNIISSHPLINPMKTKAMQIQVDKKKLQELEHSAKSQITSNNGVNFVTIEKDFGSNAMIDSVLVYVTTKSRLIEGKYGSYQICNLKDTDGNSSSINLYKQNINKLDVNSIYILENIKKTSIKTDNGI